MRFWMPLLAVALALSIPLSGSALTICAGPCPEEPSPVDLMTVAGPDESFLLAEAEPLSISLGGDGLGGLFQLLFAILLRFEDGVGPPGTGLGNGSRPLFGILRNFTFLLRGRIGDPAPPVPEPGTAGLLSLGLAAVAITRRKSLRVQRA